MISRGWVLAWAAGCAWVGGASAEEPAAAPRPYHEISRQMTELLKQEALAKTEADKAPAVVGLCELYRELAADPRLETAPTLQKYKASIWVRLTRTKEALEKQRKAAERTARTPGAEAPAEEQLPSEAELAAQAAADDAAQGVALQLCLVSESLGGPAKVFADAGSTAAGAAGGGALPDYGGDLVDLIERTIAPDFWDTAGGPGSIFYYQPVMSIVVSATQDVHEKIGGTLEALREVSP